MSIRHPNLLIIHTDQQSAWSISAYGGDLVSTPHIDRLGRDGVRCDNFFTNIALCTPSRGCFFTGRYPHCHGASRNNLPLHRDEVTFAHVLAEQGYETGYAGKWHLDGSPRPGWVHPERSMGFADCRFMFNRGHWRKIEEPGSGIQPTVHPYRVIGDEKTYATDWLTDKTINFLRKDRTAPFGYVVSIPDPHDPFAARPPYDQMFRPEDMPVPSTFSQDDLPTWAKIMRDAGPYAPDRSDREAALRRDKAAYCGAVKLIDDCTGRILNCLEQSGRLDDTVVVFTSDHGEYMGEHGLAFKNRIYETAYRVPLLIRWPERIPAGAVAEDLISAVDFQQTILSLMGFSGCGREQGCDASPLLRGERIEWTDEVHFYHDQNDFAGIFTPEYELVLTRQHGASLFDRENDPQQARDLANDPTHAQARAQLTDRIVQHHRKLGSPAAEWLPGK